MTATHEPLGTTTTWPHEQRARFPICARLAFRRFPQMGLGQGKRKYSSIVVVSAAEQQAQPPGRLGRAAVKRNSWLATRSNLTQARRAADNHPPARLP
jgi:hypothetical protein